MRPYNASIQTVADCGCVWEFGAGYMARNSVCRDADIMSKGGEALLVFNQEHFAKSLVSAKRNIRAPS